MFKLTTDTAVDLPRKELNALGVPYLPLTYIIDGKHYVDNLSEDSEFQAFYDQLLTGKMPSTSQINPTEHEEFFEKIYAEFGCDIVHITLSSGLSRTYDSACLGRDEFMSKHPGANVYIVDSLAAAIAICPILYYGIELRNNGVSGEEAANLLSERTKETQAFIIADDLFHLKRGGRISSAAAVIGSLLKIKPMLIFSDDGKLSIYKKPNGYKKAIKMAIELIGQNATDISLQTVYIANANATEQCAYAKEQLESAFGCVTTTKWIGPVIGAHTGSGTVGIVFRSSNRRNI